MVDSLILNNASALKSSSRVIANRDEVNDPVLAYTQPMIVMATTEKLAKQSSVCRWKLARGPGSTLHGVLKCQRDGAHKEDGEPDRWQQHGHEAIEKRQAEHASFNVRLRLDCHYRRSTSGNFGVSMAR
jgi:hypothetical protein